MLKPSKIAQLESQLVNDKETAEYHKVYGISVLALAAVTLDICGRIGTVSLYVPSQLLLKLHWNKNLRPENELRDFISNFADLVSSTIK